MIEQATVQIPPTSQSKSQEETRCTQQASFAVGLIETQGFTAVFEAIDTAVKTANVEVLAREKLGGGYITVVIKGDVAAVAPPSKPASAKVDGLGQTDRRPRHSQPELRPCCRCCQPSNLIRALPKLCLHPSAQLAHPGTA